MLATHRLMLRVFVFMLVALVTWIALSTRGVVETGESKTAAAETRLADALAAWEQVYSVLRQLAPGATVNAMARLERSAIVQCSSVSCCDRSFKESRS